jgi:hypothetical protein
VGCPLTKPTWLQRTSTAKFFFNTESLIIFFYKNCGLAVLEKTLFWQFSSLNLGSLYLQSLEISRISTAVIEI